MESKNAYSPLKTTIITSSHTIAVTTSTSLLHEVNIREIDNVEKPNIDLHSPLRSLSSASSSDPFLSLYESHSFSPVSNLFPVKIHQRIQDMGLPSSSMKDFVNRSIREKVGGNREEENSSSPFHLPQPWDSSLIKSARSKRNLLMERNPSSSSMRGNFSQFSSTPPSLIAFNYNENQIINNFTTADGKRLKFVLQKILQKSDVGSMSRIILPKKASESSLPSLNEKGGITIAIREVHSPKIWHMKYRFWPNNKSRMYVLENTGDYIEKHQLMFGDIVMIFRDDYEHLYISYMRTLNRFEVPPFERHSKPISLVGSSGKTVNNTVDGQWKDVPISKSIISSSSCMVVSENTQNEQGVNNHGPYSTSTCKMDEPSFYNDILLEECRDSVSMDVNDWDFNDLEDLLEFGEYDFSIFDDPMDDNIHADQHRRG